MNTKFEPDIDLNAKHEIHSRDCTDPVQSTPTARYLIARLGRLGTWMFARMKAHENRVSSLRVYSQYRLDGRASGERKDA